jgi:hypothetical protein
MVDAWAHTARQYRPSRSYKYDVPQSSSMTFNEPVGEAWPSNHVVPPPMTDFPVDLETQRRLRAANIAAAHANRRRTDSSFSRPNLGHGAPTVANSRLTASVSSSDFSQPIPRPQHSRLPDLRRVKTPSRASRIPTPVGTKTGVLPTPRHVSTPVLPSQKAKKEVNF